MIKSGCAVVPNDKEEARLDAICWQKTQQTYGATPQSAVQILDDSVEHYKSLVEESLVHRAKAIDLARQLKSSIEQNQPLSGYDLDVLNQGMVKHLKLRDNLYNVAYAHECWVKADQKTLKKWGIHYIDLDMQLKGVMLSLSAALMLFDNYLVAISIFEEDAKLRRFLNERDSGYDIGSHELAKASQSYSSIEKRRRVRNAIKFYEEKLVKASPEFFQDENFVYLKELIDQSPSYNLTRRYSPLYVLGKKVKFMTEITSDTLSELTGDGINLFSKFFGNSIGLVETRKGKLYDNPEIFNAVHRQLQAGDILLEKTPFRLTDKFIPGHWGHAAIWIGTEIELRNLGIWEHPLVKQYQEKIRAGHHIVEALRTGVELNPLYNFLNIDDLAILRKPNFDKATLAHHIILALRQIGKDYDFNFDVETTDKIVCSELIYTVYTDMEWPTERALGRYTISPDNVASKALNGELQLITFYHDGALVTENPLGLMEKLMEQPKKKAQQMANYQGGDLIVYNPIRSKNRIFYEY